MVPVTRDDQVPKPSDLLWVLKLKANEADQFTCWSTKFQGLWSHWNGKKTTPCYQNHEFCYKGHDEASLRWYGYLHGWSRKYMRPCFLEVPAVSAHTLLSMFRPGFSLRGLTFDCRRGKNPKGPVIFEYQEHLKRDASTLPPVIDCTLSVLRFWQVNPADPQLSVFAIERLSDLPGVAAG